MEKKTDSAAAGLIEAAWLSAFQLRENRDLVAALIAHLPDGVVILSAAGEMIVRNVAAACFGDVLTNPTAGGRSPAARVLRGEIIEREEYQLRAPGGATLYVLVSGRPLKEAGGEIFAALFSGSEITGRRQAEQSLQQRERRFRELFENASDIIYAHDLNGNLTSFNQAATALLGYTDEDMPLHINDIVSAEDQEKAALMISRRVNGQESSSYELRVVAKGGERYVLEVNLRLIVEAGKPVEIQGVARDVTERKQKEVELQASEARFFTIFNSNAVAMSLHSLREGRYVDVNESWLRQSGFRREEVIGRTEEEVGALHPDDYRLLRARLRETPSIKNLEVRLRSQAGEPRMGLFFTEPMEINHESCLLATILDITERKRHEDQLLLSHQEWRTTFDAIPDSVVLIDADDRLVRANRAFYEKNNQTAAAALGRPIKELVHTNPDFLSADVCPLCLLRDERRAGTIELPPGIVTAYPLFASVIPVFNAQGEYQGTLQVIRDLSALYSAREEAEQERVSLNATIEQMAEGLMIVDEQGRVLRANSSAQSLFGYSLEELRADRIGTMMDGRFADKRGRVLAVGDQPIRRALREQRTVDSRVVWYTRPDARRAFLSITASPFFNEHGRLAGAVAIVRDVTLQQKEQERLLQTDKLRALGQLASGVAHNFNNALAAILGYSQLALRQTRDPELQKYLRVIEQSSRDAARMVERIQNFSRTRSKKDEFVPVRIVDIVRDALDITRPRWRNDAEALGIKYTIALEWEAPDDLRVNGEPSELREVFVNIILNALDAMPQGGGVVISASVVKNRIRIVARDAGVGMTEEVKSRVFEPFFTTKGVAGLGLGLSESYRIVERHKGQLDVESEPQRGATFTITLPVLALRRAGIKRPSAELALPKKRFMVIDDEEVVRYAFALVLEDLGHEVAKAASAQEALDLLKRGSFDLVFTDLAMPDVDGIAVAKQIKAQLPNVRVVLMSGYSLDKLQERASETGCIDATISKPFNIPEIQKLIRRLLEQ